MDLDSVIIAGRSGDGGGDGGRVCTVLQPDLLITSSCLAGGVGGPHGTRHELGAFGLVGEAGEVG